MPHALQPTSYICIRALLYHDQAGRPGAALKDPIQALFQDRSTNGWDNKANVVEQRFAFELHLMDRARSIPYLVFRHRLNHGLVNT